MKTFTEDEKIIARNIDREYQWMARDSDGGLCVYERKPKKEESYWHAGGYDYLSLFSHLFSAVKWEDEEPTLISDIYNPQILSDAEKQYLEGVIRPFKDKVLFIIKSNSITGPSKEYISFHFAEHEVACLLCFKKGTMYKGMEPYHRYTLEELGL